MAERGNKSELSPSWYAPVVLNAEVTNADGTVIDTARGLWSDADGLIDVERKDGSTMSNMPVYKGLNVFQFAKVTANAGALTLVYFA